MSERAGPSPEKAGPFSVVARWIVRLVMIGICVAILHAFFHSPNCALCRDDSLCEEHAEAPGTDDGR